jgi:hypothetical protein
MMETLFGKKKYSNYSDTFLSKKVIESGKRGWG